jgi:hypothetical protein
MMGGRRGGGAYPLTDVAVDDREQTTDAAESDAVSEAQLDAEPAEGRAGGLSVRQEPSA